MNTLTKTYIGLGVAAALAGCSGLPERVDNLEQARAAVRRAEQDPLASQVASRQLAAAHDALNDADAAYRNRESLQLIEHDAYLAQRYADIAEQRIDEQHAKEQIADSKEQQNRILLQARTREAQAAEQRNQQIQQQNESIQQQNQAISQRTESVEQRNKELQQQLADLQAKQTEQGIVLTLGDVLFDTAQATLKPGADPTIDRLAKFMRDNMDRHVMIEGYTDSRGSDQYNQQLSQQRAAAVRNALVMRGIDPNRLRTVGLGESYPVASNDTPAGMQRNRRVEIVVSDEKGQFPAAAEDRTADSRARGASSG